jgi:hypothetical protein
MKPDKTEAASLLDAVKDQQSTVRLYTARGGVPDAMAVVLAQALGVFADPRRLDYSGFRLAVGVCASVAVAGLTVLYMARRRNLGGQIGLPTWIAAAVVFVGNVVAYRTVTGDARELARAALIGAALLGLGVAYRSAVLLLVGGAVAFALPAGMLSWPAAAIWLIPMALWIGAVGFLGRKQLRERLTI